MTETCTVRAGHATTASPTPSFRVPWRLGDAVVGRRNAGGTLSKSGHTCRCKNCSKGPSAEKTGRGSLLIVPHFLPTTQSVKGTRRKLIISQRGLTTAQSLRRLISYTKKPITSIYREDRSQYRPPSQRRRINTHRSLISYIEETDYLAAKKDCSHTRRRLSLTKRGLIAVQD